MLESIAGAYCLSCPLEYMVRNLECATEDRRTFGGKLDERGTAEKLRFTIAKFALKSDVLSIRPITNAINA